MDNDVIDTMRSLTALMEEETSRLAVATRFPEQPEIVEAKTRLSGKLAAEVARLERETPQWLDALDDDARAALAEASRALRDASLVNARVLERQIELSNDMMGAIAAEAQRLTGRQTDTYGAHGARDYRESGAPIAINRTL